MINVSSLRSPLLFFLGQSSLTEPLLIISVTIYFVVLLVFAIIAHNRGHTGVWQSSVRDTNFGAKHEPGIQMQQNQVV